VAQATHKKKHEEKTWEKSLAFPRAWKHEGVICVVSVMGMSKMN